MALLTRYVLQRFADPALERRYRVEQRGRQARFIRALTLIIASSMLVFLVVNALIRSEGLTSIGFAQLSFVPLLLGYAWAAGRPSYVENWWIDGSFFLAVQPGLLFNVQAVTESGASGWAFHNQMTYGLQLTLACACLSIAASVLVYLLLTVGSIINLGLLLSAYGYAYEPTLYTVFQFSVFALLLLYVNWAIDDKARRLFKARSELSAERDKSELLLANVLPPPVASRLRSQEAVADDFPNVAVIFADIVGFTRVSKHIGARATVEMLNAFFSRADHGLELFGIEKVKTIGDAYMAVSGALTKPPRPEKAAIDFAIFLVHEAHRVGERLGLEIKVRVGINSGPVVGGVISSKRLSYDYWGDTINVAARLQGLAREDGITVSEAVHAAIGDSYPFLPPRRVNLKNLGGASVFDLDLEEELSR
jgi:class 3 adenylate cyclase